MKIRLGGSLADAVAKAVEVNVLLDVLHELSAVALWPGPARVGPPRCGPAGV